jgi:hypothetical protein
MKKLPDDSFAFYLALGRGRSYQAVADHFDVDKKTVTNRAVRENWQDKLLEHEDAERKRMEKKAAESIEAMNDRQLKLVSFIQAKAVEALKTLSLDSAMDAVRALQIAIEKERLIRGEPTERSAIDIEKKIRTEHERWIVPELREHDAGATRDGTEDQQESEVIDGQQLPSSSDGTN